MDPSQLIPLADPLPIPWVWFDVLLIVTFTAHILFMNALLGSAAIGLFRSFQGSDNLAHDVGQKSPPLLALTINMGVAPLLFLQVNYGHFDYVSSVLMGGWWLAVILALLISYYGFYTYKFGYGVMTSGKRNALFLVSILGLLYVGFMLSNNMTLMLKPEVWPEYFTRDSGFLNLSDPVLYPRFLHFMVATIAIGGLFIAILGKWRNVDEYIEIGMRWFFRATMVNLAVGIWFLMALPGDMMLNFMGRNLPATVTFCAGLFGAATVLHFAFRNNVVQTTVWTVITVFLMASLRHWLRTFYLDPWFKIETTPVTHQYGSFYLFLGFLVAGLILVGYMLKLYFKSREGEA